MAPVVPLHHQLVRPADQVKPVGVVELLTDVLWSAERGGRNSSRSSMWVRDGSHCFGAASRDCITRQLVRPADQVKPVGMVELPTDVLWKGGGQKQKQQQHVGEGTADFA